MSKVRVIGVIAMLVAMNLVASTSVIAALIIYAAVLVFFTVANVLNYKKRKANNESTKEIIYDMAFDLVLMVLAIVYIVNNV